MITGYVGTYTSDLSEGIYKIELDETNGHLSKPKLFKKVNNSKYLAWVDNLLYALYDDESGSGVMVIDKNGNTLASLIYENVTSAHLGVKGEYIYTANYHEGTVSKLHYANEKITLIKKVTIQRKAGCHQIIFFKDMILVPCLFMDKIFIYDEDLELINEIMLPHGSGPRHGVISTDDTRLYIVTELSNELFTFDYANHHFHQVHQISILPNYETHKEGSAALRISRNGRKLYVSTRGVDLITVVDIGAELPKILQFESSGGKHPRDILDVANDRYLLVLNRFSNELLSYKLNDGRLGIVSSKVELPEGVSIVMEGDLND
ncbi:beta-propeller fold lactonase family protein [Anaerorhabdus sp.]|uniref:beta-propeller fold lactonase family protein n=1 Tax=Anaerorhabdus sp. TaxID=1872524 RepID=UPI002FC9CA23